MPITSDAPLPSARITHTSKGLLSPLPRRSAKAMNLPSGDQTGE
jgi:hypothetical protein